MTDVQILEEIMEKQDLELPKEEVLQELSFLINSLLDYKELLEEAQNEVKEFETKIRELETRNIPDKLIAAGISKFALTDGTEISLVKEYFPNIKKENQREAYEWLKENGFSGLIKHVIQSAFSKGDDKKADAFRKVLQDNLISYEEKESIHGQTLKAWAKEQVQIGTNIPEELISIYHGNNIKIVKGNK